ncbi:hypothetical protein V6N13_117687 [Hibiscus sabdariffa]
MNNLSNDGGEACNGTEGITDTVQGKVVTLTRALQRGSSPQFSQKPYDKVECRKSTPVQSRDRMKQLKQKFLVDASCNILNSKTAVPNVDSTHSTSNDQPLTMAHIQGREVDIGVMSELNCALDQKEAILTERRNSNDNKLENRAFQEAYCNGFFCFT